MLENQPRGTERGRRKKNGFGSLGGVVSIFARSLELVCGALCQ